MNKVLTGILASIAVLISVPAYAGGIDCRSGVDHKHPACYAFNHVGHRHWNHQHHHHHHRHHGGLNSTEKVIIGAIIGGVVVDAIHRNRPAPEPTVVYAPPLPPQPYPAPAQTCITREVTDRYGRVISTERTCY